MIRSTQAALDLLAMLHAGIDFIFRDDGRDETNGRISSVADRTTPGLVSKKSWLFGRTVGSCTEAGMPSSSSAVAVRRISTSHNYDKSSMHLP